MTTTDKIRKLLKEKHKTQRDLAEYLGCDRSYGILSAADHGKTTLNLDKVAAFLGVTVEDLTIEKSATSTDSLNAEEQYILETYRMFPTYADHRRLLDVCDQLRSESGDLGNTTTA